MDEHSEQPRGFRVTDRRRFTDEGAGADAPDASTDDMAATSSAPLEEGRTHPAADAPVTFSTFVMGLSTQALFLLGEIPDPGSGQPKRDLLAAKQVIDILGILSVKTANNLEQDERSLLDSVLYDLRMRYVQLVRAGASKEGS